MAGWGSACSSLLTLAYKERFPELNQYNLDGQIHVTETYIPKTNVVHLYDILNVLPANQLPI